MKNTGELKLTLPELPDDWTWRVSITTPNDSTRHEDSIIIKLTRGIFEKDGKIMHHEIWIGVPIDLKYMGYPKDYDEIIKETQHEVNRMFEDLTYRNLPRLTQMDALKHIVDTVQGRAAVTEMLHLYDIENV